MAKAQTYNRTQTGNREAAANLSQQGQVEQKLGNHARAIELFRQALASDPSHAGALSLLVQSLLRRSEFEESGRLLATALAIDPSRTSTWIEVADLFALKGNRATASSAMILAYRLWPDKIRAQRYFQDRAQNDERLELRPIYQSALRSIQTIPLRGG
jgi:tetratricopeptide (TPR) repeat protein